MQDNKIVEDAVNNENIDNTNGTNNTNSTNNNTVENTNNEAELGNLNINETIREREQEILNGKEMENLNIDKETNNNELQNEEIIDTTVKNEVIVDRMINNTELSKENKEPEPIAEDANMWDALDKNDGATFDKYIEQKTTKPYEPANAFDERIKKLNNINAKNLGIKEVVTDKQQTYLIKHGITDIGGLLAKESTDREFNKIRDEIVGRKALKPEEIKSVVKEYVELKNAHDKALVGPANQALYDEEQKALDKTYAALVNRGIDPAAIVIFEEASDPAKNVDPKVIDEVCNGCANHQKQAVLAKAYLETHSLDKIVKEANHHIDEYFEKMNKNHFTKEMLDKVGEDLYSLYHHANQVNIGDPNNRGAYKDAISTADRFAKMCLDKGMPASAVEHFRNMAASPEKPKMDLHFTSMSFNELKKVEAKDVINEFYGKLAVAFEANKYPCGANIDSNNLKQAAMILREMAEYKRVMDQTNRKPSRALIDTHLDKMRRFLEVKGLTKGEISQLETAPIEELKGVIESLAPAPVVNKPEEAKPTEEKKEEVQENKNRTQITISKEEIEGINNDSVEPFTKEELASVRNMEKEEEKVETKPEAEPVNDAPEMGGLH